MKPLSFLFGARRAARDPSAASAPPRLDAAGATPVPPLRPRVEIPVRDPAPEAEARTKHLERGRFLARQEAWDEISAEIGEADSNRRLTPGLTPVAELLAAGARADVVAAARQPALRGEVAQALAMLDALDREMAETGDCPAIACVLAMAHLDLARTWRGASDPQALAGQRRSAYQSHMRRAAELADRFDPFETDSPLWAAVRCAMLEAEPNPAARAADDYEDLIDLDPGNPGPMLALGRDLGPSRFGSWSILDRQARRTAGRTRDLWGVGGYTWVHIGAMECDPTLVLRLDVELFVEGLHDILHRQPGQHMANRLAAFAGLTLGGPAEPGTRRARVADCLAWIAQDHLRELHPLVWAQVPIPGRDIEPELEEADLVRRGRIRAMSSLAAFYAPALETGHRLVFGPEGMQLIKGA